MAEKVFIGGKTVMTAEGVFWLVDGKSLAFPYKCYLDD